jgi:hypothetical protein
MFRISAAIPEGANIAEADPPPAKTTERYIAWDLPKLASTVRVTLRFELAGLQKGDFDANELFVQGINDVHVVGADEWHGGE